MVTEVKFLSNNAQIADLTFPLWGLSPNAPIHIRDITGLDPVAAEIITKANADDGDFFIDSRVGKRNIVITFGLNPGAGYDAVETARRLLYAYALPKGTVKLQFASTNRGLVTIDGIVESVGAPLFVKDPQVQVSFICPRSNFLAKNPVFVTGVTGEDPNGVEFINPGDMLSRIELEVHSAVGVNEEFFGSLRLEARDTRPEYRGFQIFETKYYYTNGQDPVPEVTINDEQFFYLSSYQGQKLVESRYETFYALIYDEVTYLSLLRWVQLTDLWPYLSPGVNRFRVLTEPLIDSNTGDPIPDSAPEMPWTLKYYPQYGGL